MSALVPVADHLYVAGPRTLTFVDPAEGIHANMERLSVLYEQLAVLRPAADLLADEVTDAPVEVIGGLRTVIGRLEAEHSERSRVPVGYFDCACAACA